MVISGLYDTTTALNNHIMSMNTHLTDSGMTFGEKNWEKNFLSSQRGFKPTTFHTLTLVRRSSPNKAENNDLTSSLRKILILPGPIKNNGSGISDYSCILSVLPKHDSENDFFFVLDYSEGEVT